MPSAWLAVGAVAALLLLLVLLSGSSQSFCAPASLDWAASNPAVLLADADSLRAALAAAGATRVRDLRPLTVLLRPGDYDLGGVTWGSGVSLVPLAPGVRLRNAQSGALPFDAATGRSGLLLQSARDLELLDGCAPLPSYGGCLRRLSGSLALPAAGEERLGCLFLADCQLQLLDAGDAPAAILFGVSAREVRLRAANLLLLHAGPGASPLQPTPCAPGLQSQHTTNTASAGSAVLPPADLTTMRGAAPRRQGCAEAAYAAPGDDLHALLRDKDLVVLVGGRYPLPRPLKVPPGKALLGYGSAVLDLGEDAGLEVQGELQGVAVAVAAGASVDAAVLVSARGLLRDVCALVAEGGRAAVGVRVQAEGAYLENVCAYAEGEMQTGLQVLASRVRALGVCVSGALGSALDWRGDDGVLVGLVAEANLLPAARHRQGRSAPEVVRLSCAAIGLLATLVLEAPARYAGLLQAEGGSCRAAVVRVSRRAAASPLAQAAARDTGEPLASAPPKGTQTVVAC